GDEAAVGADAGQGQAEADVKAALLAGAVAERVDVAARAAAGARHPGVGGVARRRRGARRVAGQRERTGADVVHVQLNGARRGGDGAEQVGGLAVEDDRRAVAADDRVERTGVAGRGGRAEVVADELRRAGRVVEQVDVAERAAG